MLALHGEKDLQVPAKENLALIAEALKAGGNTRFTVREFPGLTHGFNTPHTEETMSPAVLQTISDWILAQAHPAGTTAVTSLDRQIR